MVDQCCDFIGQDCIAATKKQNGSSNRLAVMKVESYIYLLEKKEEMLTPSIRQVISNTFDIEDDDASVVNSIISRDWRVFNYLIE
jgi:hypothetical protein